MPFGSCAASSPGSCLPLYSLLRANVCSMLIQAASCDSTFSQSCSCRCLLHGPNQTTAAVLSSQPQAVPVVASSQTQGTTQLGHQFCCSLQQLLTAPPAPHTSYVAALLSKTFSSQEPCSRSGRLCLTDGCLEQHSSSRAARTDVDWQHTNLISIPVSPADAPFAYTCSWNGNKLRG
jgi:hypothetical protein